MRFLLSIAIWTAGMLLTIVLYFAMLISVILFPFDRQRKAAHAQCYWWSDALVGMNPYWKLEVKGLENIDRGKTYVIVMNHQSMADVFILYKIRTQFKWIAKESLFRIPFFGWCMRLADYMKLTRGDFSSIKKVYRQAAMWLRSGMSVAFFPEGTRSNTDDMQKFLNGAFKLAIKEKKQILPIAVKGTRDAIPKGSWIFSTRVKGTLEVLPAIDTDGFEPRDFERLKQITRLKIANALH